jgi:uncharacterized protein (DUF2252 family)
MASKPSRKTTAHRPFFDGEKRIARAKVLRRKVPRESHAEWKAWKQRDPIQILEQASVHRVPRLLPIRYGRMLRSPFSFYRGAAAIMAADLARTPASGLHVQACGDCHLLNFGGFGTPERRVIFDLNDFDETLPAPWEWDVKRLAASFVIAGRSNGFKARRSRQAAGAAVKSYRRRLSEFSCLSNLEVWYASLDSTQVLNSFRSENRRQFIRDRARNARQRTITDHDFPELTSLRNGRPAIRDNPPLIYHPQERILASHKDFRKAFHAYRQSLSAERRTLLDRYQVMDVATKVVGVGSVGTRCGVMLLMASEWDPLFLQVKEARRSVLERWAGRSAYPNHGQRVVVGQRLIQPASDIFLGWTVSEGADFYIRQLRDLKFKPLVESMDPSALVEYASICGWALARAHARSGDALAISGYLGRKDIFDEAIADFAEAYADQTEKDHAALAKAVRDGRISARTDI